MLEPDQQPEALEAVAPPVPPIASRPRARRWYHKLLRLLGILLCFEMGVFLLIFPWASEWTSNLFARMPLWAKDVWGSPYFRGAVSGLGVVDIYISFVEALRLRRF